jgi:hypothetical protein
VDLRHRHRHAAGDAGEREEALEGAGREVDPAGGERGGGLGRGRVGGGDAAAEEQAARQDDRHHDGGDHEIGCPPACGFEHGREEERPDRAGEVVA